MNSRARMGKRYRLLVLPIWSVGPGHGLALGDEEEVVPPLPCTTESSVTGPFLTVIWMESPLPGLPW